MSTKDKISVGELAPGQAPPPTGQFWCSRCGKSTLHRMTAQGWKKGPCLECEFKAKQLELFPDKAK